MTLYIYRVGWTYLARNPFTDLNLLKTLIVLGLLDLSDRSDLPVRPVGPCRTGHSASTGQTARSDQSDRLVSILTVNNTIVHGYVYITKKFGNICACHHTNFLLPVCPFGRNGH